MRRPRFDEPGSWHHVTNRAIARRTLFESRSDIRFFLGRTAREVHRGRIEVHAYTVLTTHFHLVVRSLRGELDRVMRQIQNDYVRRFNRARRRDGPLLRGRYFSKRARCDTYLATLVRYVDFNAVRAGLARTPSSYPWCSAHHHVLARQPPWLETRWVDAQMDAEWVRGTTRRDRYLDRFDRPPTRGEVRLVEATGPDGDDRLDDLLSAAPDRVLRWMRWKARLADRGDIGTTLCELSDIRTALEHSIDSGAMSCSDTRLTAAVGLARQLTGATWKEIALEVDRPISTIHRRSGDHLTRLDSDPEYAGEIARAAQMAVRRSLARP